MVPLPFRRAGRYAEQVSDFLELQAREETEFHDAGLARAEPRELVESCIKRQNIDIHCGRRRRISGRQGSLTARSALGGTFLPDVIDEDLAHGPSRERQEVLPIDEAQARAPSEFQIRLVNQSGRGQGFAGPAARELHSGEPSQVLVRDSEELVRRVGIALPPGGEKLFDVAGH